MRQKKLLADHKPELILEWDFEKNGELTPYNTTIGMKTIAWWICKNNERHKWEAQISSRAKENGTNCPYCVGKKVLIEDSFGSLYKHLIEEWDWENNKNLNPYELAPKARKKVGWICKKDNRHKWDATIGNRTHNESGCPYCSGNRVNETNCLSETHPDVARLLWNPRDGLEHSFGSKSKIDWKCPNCNFRIREKSIGQITYNGLSCPQCSDGVSYPNKFLLALLNQLDIEFDIEKKFNWIEKRKYDFYIPMLNTIIEVHGLQHYERTLETYNNKTLKEEQENDRLKQTTAMENGIKHYIVVDARYSDMEWIKNSILNSYLSELFDLSSIDWNK